MVDRLCKDLCVDHSQRESAQHLTFMHIGSAGTSAAAEAGQTEGPSDRALRQYELQNMQGIEDTSILEDLAEAEEGYDKPDQVKPVNVLEKTLHAGLIGFCYTSSVTSQPKHCFDHNKFELHQLQHMHSAN